MGIYDDYLGINGVAPTAATAPLDPSLWTAYAKLEDVRAKAKAADTRTFATALAAQVKAQVSLQKAQGDLLAKLSATQGRLRGDAMKATVDNLKSIRASYQKLAQVNQNAVGGIIARARTAADGEGGLNSANGAAAYIMELSGALAETGLTHPGLGFQNEVVEQAERELGFEFGGVEYDRLLQFSAQTAWERGKELKANAEMDADAHRRGFNEIYRDLDVVEGELGKGGELDSKKLLPLVTQTFQKANAALAAVSADPKMALEAERKALDEEDQYKRLNTMAEHLAGQLAGTGADATSAREELAKLVMKPKFIYWARQNGFDGLGSATFDENGKLLTYAQGAQDAHAAALFHWQLTHGDKGLFGRGRPLFHKSTGVWGVAPLGADPEKLRGADGKFLVLKGPDGTLQYLNPADAAERAKDAGDAPEVEEVVGGATVGAKAEEGSFAGFRVGGVSGQYFTEDASGLLQPVDAPANAQSLEAVPAILADEQGNPLRYARAADLAAPTSASRFVPAVPTAAAAVQAKLPTPEATDVPPPPGAQVVGKQLTLTAKDLKHLTVGEDGVPRGASRMLGRRSDTGEMGEFLIVDGKIVEEAPVAGGIGREELSEVTHERSSEKPIEKLRAAIAARQAGWRPDKADLVRPPSKEPAQAVGTQPWGPVQGSDMPTGPATLSRGGVEPPWGGTPVVEAEVPAAPEAASRPGPDGAPPTAGIAPTRSGAGTSQATGEHLPPSEAPMPAALPAAAPTAAPTPVELAAGTGTSPDAFEARRAAAQAALSGAPVAQLAAPSAALAAGAAEPVAEAGAQQITPTQRAEAVFRAHAERDAAERQGTSEADKKAQAEAREAAEAQQRDVAAAAMRARAQSMGEQYAQSKAVWEALPSRAASVTQAKLPQVKLPAGTTPEELKRLEAQRAAMRFAQEDLGG